MAYRDFLGSPQNGLWYNYGQQPQAMTVDKTAAPQQQSNWAPEFGLRAPHAPMPPTLDGGNSVGIGSSGVGGTPGTGVSVGPSSVNGVGPSSIGANVSNGNNIAALMGLVGLAAPAPVGMVAAVPGLMGMMGITGLTDNVAVSNDQSSNSVANDVGAIEGLANAMGLGVDSAGPVSAEAAASSPGNNAEAAATGPGSGGDGGSGAAGTGEGDSGAWARGGRAYHRFKEGGRPPIKKRVHKNFPGIWDDPRLIADDAHENTIPEDPAMKELFGLNRGELYERFKDRTGNISGRELLNLSANPRGSAAARNMMTPGNAQRLIDILSEAEGRAPELTRGMHSWYAMDPVHDRLRQLHGDDMADHLYRRFNTFSGMASPQSTVQHEIARGTAANTLNNRGRFGDFEKFAAVPAEERGAIPQFPPDMMHVPGSIAHATAQAGPMKRFIDSDEVNMTKPKVPLYIGASSVPSLGFQSDWVVPDSHFSRGIGLADTRTEQANPSSSMKNAEIADIAPWFKRFVADPMGIEAVPAQARLWGTMGHLTGVSTPVGAPKLELLSSHINNRARERGMDPREMRDAIISGEDFARGGRIRHPVPRAMNHLYRQFVDQRLA